MAKATVLNRSLPNRRTQKIRSFFIKPIRFIDRRPMLSFFLILVSLLTLIVISNFFSRPKPQVQVAGQTVKTVSVYRIGSAPKITVSAQTRKSGVIQITALSGGIIDKLNVSEGTQVTAGDTLVSLSSNYKGDNSLSIQRRIADQQYFSNSQTFKTQKEIIKRQKELAEKNADNAEELHKITTASLDETKILISRNEDMLKLLDQQINDFNQLAPNPNFADRQLLIPLRAQQVQFTASLNQTKQTLRTSDYNASSDNPPAEIAKLTKEIAVRQLDVQEKQLAMSLEVSRLQSQLAAVSESLMFPSAPFGGTIQRVLVKEKQQVSAGTPLLIIAQAVEEDPVTAVAFVSADVARRVSRLETSLLHIGDKVTYGAVPSFVSTEAVQGSLYAIYYPIPDQYNHLVVSEGFISVDMPIGYANTSMIATYIPLDAVYQTREMSYVFVISGDTAKSRTVTLGQVYGGYVEVLSGLTNGDAIILNRNIIHGDKVQIL